jgi:hypothetical protein
MFLHLLNIAFHIWLIGLLPGYMFFVFDASRTTRSNHLVWPFFFVGLLFMLIWFVYIPYGLGCMASRYGRKSLE